MMVKKLMMFVGGLGCLMFLVLFLVTDSPCAGYNEGMGYKRGDGKNLDDVTITYYSVPGGCLYKFAANEKGGIAFAPFDCPIPDTVIEK